MRGILRPISAEIFGGHMHRSGWPYVLNCLEPLFSASARLVFDDFLEKTICNQREGLDRYVHTQPWVGVCHYPQDAPQWYETEHLQDLPLHDSWTESLAHMRLCITLGENLAVWIRSNWNVPCISLKHPTEVPPVTWSVEKFLGNEQPLLLQVGWYLRNTRAIFQVDPPAFLRKAWLRSGRDIAAINHERCGVYFQPGRTQVGTVLEIEPVDNDEYDSLLARNVVFVELITSVANNTIIECIARNAPIVVNRLPAPENYLGKEYPLFYDDFRDVGTLITREKIISAHEYLAGLDKSWIDGSAFRESLVEACIKYVPDIVRGS